MDFEYITRADGLANSSVSSIVQDRWGFLWFGTQGGLHKYDGYEFTVYGFEPFAENCLSHNLVQTLYLEKEKDVLWVGTYGGLNRFDMKTGTFTVYRHSQDVEDSLSNDIIVSILRDSRGDLWVGTLAGLNVMKSGTDTFRRYRYESGGNGTLAGNVVRAIHEDLNGNIWIGTTGGFQKYDRENDAFITFIPDSLEKNVFPGAAVMAVTEDGSGTLWIGTWGGSVTAFNPSTGSFRALPLPGENVYALLFDKTTLFAATWGQGLLEIDTETFRVIKRITCNGSISGISHDTVYSLHKDDSGIIWIGTNGGGINKLDRRKNPHTLYRHDPKNQASIADGKINVVYEDSEGTLWAGIYNGGLDRFDAGTNSWRHYTSIPGNPRSLIDNNVTSILEDSAGRLLVGTYRGIEEFDRKTGAFSRFTLRKGEENRLTGQIIYALLEDRAGNIWIGTYHSGLIVYNPSSGTVRTYSHDPADKGSLSDNLVYRIMEDQSGGIWIGTNHGLNRYDSASESFTRYLYNPAVRSGLSGNSIRSLYQDKGGAIWVGTTGGGLSVYEPETGTFANYWKDDGLPDGSIIGILEDLNGVLWAATPNGIAIYDRSENSFITLDDDNGILARECTPGCTRTDTGVLYFGSIEGLQRIDAREQSKPAFSPGTIITAFSVNGEEKQLDTPIYMLDSVTLTWEERHLSFTFAALDYTAPQKNRFMFMLEGFDTDWQYSGTRNFASYTNISHGTYTFRVRSTNTSGVQSPNEARIAIHILPPPWRTGWAYFLYIVFTVAVTYAVSEILTSAKLKQKVRELNGAREELKQANEKLEKLSTTDDLTEIPNKRHFFGILEKEWKHCIREQSRMSILMLDMDFFKAYNDNYGHLAGDACLKAIAGAITRVLERPRDIVARFGGEEFVILLPGTDAEGAAFVAEKIRSTILELEIPHAYSGVAPFLTVSIGVSTTAPAADRSPEEHVEYADAALYQAKRSGRNRVVTYQTV